MIVGLAVVVRVNAADYRIVKLDNEVKRIENRASKGATNQAQRLERIKREASRLIEKRLNSLNRLLERVNNYSKLTQDEKSSLASSIQVNIDGLNALKEKINADTDVETAKADAKTIITNYYIYRMFEPKIRLLLATDRLQDLSANLSNTSVSLQNLINTLKSEGKDTASLQVLLDDINSQLSTINTTLSNDEAKLNSLTVSSDFTTILNQVRQDLRLVKTNFAKIRSDIAQMRSVLNELTKSSSP